MFIELHQSTQILKSDLNGYFINLNCCYWRLQWNNETVSLKGTMPVVRLIFSALPGALGGFLGGAVGVVPRR